MNTTTETVSRLLLTDIRPSPTNPRRSFDDDSLRELTESVRQLGVLQDILVRPIPANGSIPRLKGDSWFGVGHFEIVAGERRWRAAQAAGLRDIGAKVREMSDEDVLAIQLVENDQREDVKPTEQAAAYKRLVDAVGLAEAAKRIGKAESTVRGIVQIAKAPPALAQAVDAGLVSRSVAELVCRVPGERSRERAALLVLSGTPYHQPTESDDLIRARMKDGREQPLTHRETKELIGRYFTRELKTAPFSRTALYLLPGCDPDRNDYYPKCETCPKRAGNDPAAKAEGVRADVCLDPECFEEKVKAHRQAEIERFAKKHKIDAASVPTVEMNGFIPAGWVETSAKVLETELARDGDGYMNWKRKPKPDVTVIELLTDPDGIPTILPGTCRLHLAIDAKGKPHTLVKTADVRKNLVRAEIIAKPKPTTKATPTANGKPASTPASTPAAEGPYLLYRLKLNPDVMPVIEFDAVDGTEPDELREQAASEFMDWFDAVDWSDSPVCPRPFVDYERVQDAEANDLAPSADEPKPFTYDDLIRDSLHVQEGSESRWKTMIEQGATDPEIKAALAAVWGLGGGSSRPASDDRPRHEYRYKGGTKPSLECTLGDDPDGPLKLSGVPLISRVRIVLGIPYPDEVQTSAPPGPIVCDPVGSGRLADIPGITAEDVNFFSAVGITTLAGLEQKVDALRAERGRQNATVYDVLRNYPGLFDPDDVNRIGDAIMDHLNVAKAVGATVDAEPKAKGKRKAVSK